MKVVNILEIDDFDRQEVPHDVLLVHLWRVQAARTKQFDAFFQELQRDHFGLGWDMAAQNRVMSDSKEASRLLSPAERHDLSREELRQFEVRRLRMVKAKQDYEQAGGKYD